MYRRSFSLVIVGLFALISASGQLRIATYQYGANNRIENLMPLSEVIGERLQEPVEVLSFSGIFDLVSAIREGRIDVALLSTFGYLYLEKSDCLRTITPLVSWSNDTSAADNYRTVFFTWNGSGITSMDQLKDQGRDLKIAFVNPGSTSGSLIPRMMLDGMNIPSAEAHFKAVAFGGTHEATASMVAQKDAHVGAIGSNTYAEFVRKNPETLLLLRMSPRIPLGPIVVSNRLSTKTKAVLSDILTRLHETHPAAFAAVRNGWSEARYSPSFKAVGPADYLDIFKLDSISENLIKIISAESSVR